MANVSFTTPTNKETDDFPMVHVPGMQSAIVQSGLTSAV